MPINLKNLTLDFQDVAGGNRALLVSARDDNEYGADNKPTGKRLGSRYDICCFASGFHTVTVKIPNAPLAITQEKLDELNSTEELVFTSFAGFEATLYQNFRSDEKEVKAKAIATDIELTAFDGTAID